jgi:hypothetical protein
MPDAAPHADRRVHGPAICPRAPAGCEACSGEHHWLESSCMEPEDDFDRDDNRRERSIRAFDEEHKTDHAAFHFVCKHCDTWAESDFVEELMEPPDDQGWDWDCWCGEALCPGCDEGDSEFYEDDEW